jgi:hypothetical protein
MTAPPQPRTAAVQPGRNRWLGVRPADEILWPAALGRMKACRLSFGVAVVDRMLRERWRVHLDRAHEGVPPQLRRRRG